MSPATRDLLDRETALVSRFPGLNTSREQAILVLEAGPDQALAVLQHLKDDPSLAFAQLTDLTAVDYPERGQLVLVYRLTHLPEYDTVVVKVALPREAPEAPSVSRLWHNAGWLEREIFDLFGVVFTGHPHLTRLLLWEDFVGHPLRKDFALPGTEGAAAASEQAATSEVDTVAPATSEADPEAPVTPEEPGRELRDEEITLNVGPQHPSTHGVFRFKVRLDGETIVEVEPVIGYVHRGVEKLMESRNYFQIIPYTDRLDYLASMFNNQAYVTAVERLAGIEVPERAEYLRVIACELNRLASHLVAVGTYGLDVGALTPFLYTFREREKIYDLMEMLCGARMLYAYMRIGGVGYDVPDGFYDRLRALLDEMPRRLDEYEAMLTTNELFLARTKGIGVLSPAGALRHGVTGPNLRACGVPYDLRRADPYSLYPTFDFEVPVGEHGDSYDRYLVRVKEMRESVKILRQALERCPREGPLAAKVSRLLKPEGEAYAHVESPRGELGCYLVADGTANPYRFRWRAPSFHHLSLIRGLARGAKIADLIAIFGSIDIIGAEVDR